MNTSTTMSISINTDTTLDPDAEPSRMVFNLREVDGEYAWFRADGTTNGLPRFSNIQSAKNWAYDEFGRNSAYDLRVQQSDGNYHPWIF